MIDFEISITVLAVACLVFGIALWGIWTAVKIERLEKRVAALETSSAINRSAPATC